MLLAIFTRKDSLLGLKEIKEKRIAFRIHIQITMLTYPNLKGSRFR